MSAIRSLLARHVRLRVSITLELWTSPGKLTNVRVKPIHNKLEFAYQLDVDSDNFDLSSEQHTDALRLGSRAVPPKTNYAIGVFRPDAGGLGNF